MKLNLFSINKKYSQLLLVVLIVLSGLFFRGIKYQGYPFAFDQVQIASNADRIYQGQPTLIGPRTGPAEMFTGPLIYYIAAPFVFVVGPALSTVAASLFISAATGIALCFLGKFYLANQQRILILGLWAFSPLIIEFDRIPWNPNLTFLASALSFFPLLKKSRLKRLDLVLIALGVFLGYQAHFSGLLLLPLVSLLLLTRGEVKQAIAPAAGFALSLLPTVVFDWRHNWLNSRGLQSLLGNKDQVSTFLAVNRFIDNLYILVETTGKILVGSTDFKIVLTAGALSWLVFLYLMFIRARGYSKQKNHIDKYISNKTVIYSLIWIILVVTALALYRGSNPEYYYFIALPPLFYILSNLILISPLKKEIVLLGLFMVSALHVYFIKPFDGLSLGAQQQVINYLQEYSEKNPIKEVIFDIKAADSLGLKYLLSMSEIKMADDGVVVHAAYPVDLTFSEPINDTEVHFWVDPRDDPELDYFSNENFIVGLPNGWQLTESWQSQDKTLGKLFLIIDRESSVMGELFAIEHNLLDTLEKREVKESGELVSKVSGWGLVTINDNLGYIRVNPSNNFVFFIPVDSGSILNSIQIYP